MLDLNDAYRLPIHVLRFLVWNADDDLAQATWEWPKRPSSRVAEVYALAWDHIRESKGAIVVVQKPHMERQFYGN